MDIELILKVAGVGMVVTVVCQILSKLGRDEQSTYVSIAGIVVVLLLLIEEIASLISLLREVFGI
ncbi:MAG: stage III sporulation protein AC [Clostridia bacterium]|nr:stage III sporulation protein AC [Clostridia bacterium]